MSDERTSIDKGKIVSSRAIHTHTCTSMSLQAAAFRRVTRNHRLRKDETMWHRDAVTYVFIALEVVPLQSHAFRHSLAVLTPPEPVRVGVYR